MATFNDFHVSTLLDLTLHGGVLNFLFNFPQNEYQGGLTFVKTVKLYVYLFKKLTSPSQLLPLLDHCASPPESLQKQEQRHNPLNTAGMLIHPQLAKNIPCHVKKCLETV